MTTVDIDHLAYERTVSRTLVHRRAVAEVFVTDLVARPGAVAEVAVQLPRTHSYYCDGPEPLDVLLVQECFRQAATAVAHEHHGVPAGTAFLVTTWRGRLDPSAARATDELVIRVAGTGARHRDGELVALTLELELRMAGDRIGTATIGARYLARDRFVEFRQLLRHDPPPLSDGMPGRGPGTPVDPARVGRRLPENVVLADVEVAADGMRGLLDVPTRHAGLYDHPLDHVPAMALLEAARQAAVVLGGPDRPAVTGLDAGFRRFVELDAPVTVTARPVAPGRVAVAFDQDGSTACDVQVGVRPGSRS